MDIHTLLEQATTLGELAVLPMIVHCVVLLAAVHQVTELIATNLIIHPMVLLDTHILKLGIVAIAIIQAQAHILKITPAILVHFVDTQVTLIVIPT